MSETRKLTAILVSDVVGYSRLAGADEERTLARLRALRSDLIDPTLAVHHGRVVKRHRGGQPLQEPPHESTRAHGPAAAADWRRRRFARGRLSRGARSLHRVVQDDRERRGRKSSLRSAGYGHWGSRAAAESHCRALLGVGLSRRGQTQPRLTVPGRYRLRHARRAHLWR